ncbi:tetratricopeptide repeat protein 24 [Pseudorasbora parva]|uniref:tetratricopeptide repeat protein 24 n=1 Tax=Pseudorasbora parva TaxID=51549 RepID=UPI00351EAB4C
MASDGSSVRDAREKQKQKRSSTGRSDLEDKDTHVEIERLTAAGHAALQTGDHNAALRRFKSALRAATKLREKRLQRTCALNLGAAFVEAGEPRRGLEVLELAQPGERGQRVAELQFNRATAHEALGEPRQAASHYLQAAQLYRSQGDAGAEADTCVRLARCQLHTEEWDEAVASFRRAAESYRAVGNTPAAALALKDAGKHMLQSGRNASDDIISVLTDSLEMSIDITDQETLGKLLNDVGLSFSQMRLFSEASECYEQALPLVASKPHRLAVVLQNLGAVHNALGQFQQAVQFHREAAALHGSLGSRGAQGRCFSNLGFALVELEELEEAWESYIHALQAFRDTDDPSGQWQVCEGLGGIKLQMRDPQKASVYYKEALQLLCRCQDVSSSVQERLVSKLSEALQQKLLIQQRGAATQRHHHRRLPRSTAVRSDVQQGRPNGVTDAEISPTKQHNGSESPHQEQEPADHHNTLPEANRNLNNTYDKAEVHPQNVQSESTGPGGVCAESVKPRPVQINGAHPLVRSSVTPPLMQNEHAQAMPLTRRLKSRFCTVM